MLLLERDRRRRAGLPQSAPRYAPAPPFWDSMDAIRAFAGDDVHRARYYPPDIDHYEVVADER